MDKLKELCRAHASDPYILVGDAEYNFIKSDVKAVRRPWHDKLIARVNKETHMESGQPELFFYDGVIRLGIRGSSGKFYKIVGDDAVLEVKRPSQPKWFKELIKNE